jgi:D-serine deaminase-like pyridoxal phosphate-dependent protein
MNITELETPCLILDKNKLKHNIKRYNDQIKRLGINSRPHGKTAKNIDVLKMCLTDKSQGITVSTLKESEYYFSHGIKDIIYAVGIAPVKLERVVNLINKGCELTIILDSVEQAEAVSTKASEHNIQIPVCIEVDCDGQRSGIKPDDQLLVDLAKMLNDSNNIELRGILTHAGASYHCKNTEDIKSIAAMERDTALRCAERFKQNYLPCPMVSIGSTPTALFAEDFQGITEVRAGVYMFMDLVMEGLEVCKLEDIAVSVLASVIGHQKNKGWVIIDSGWTALSRDRSTSGQKIDQGYGLVCDVDGQPLDDYIVSATSQEHGIITHRDSFDINWEHFPIGGRVRILPNHACATATMFDTYHVVSNSFTISETWSRINGW